MRINKGIKVLSFFTLVSPITSFYSNHLYQSLNNIIYSKNNLFFSNATQEEMGDIIVEVETDTNTNEKIITKYVSGQGILKIKNDITQIASSAFINRTNVINLDLSEARMLVMIGNNAFQGCTNLVGDLIIPSSVTSIGNAAFNSTKIASLDLSHATSLTTIGQGVFSYIKTLFCSITIPPKLILIGNRAFEQSNITSLDLSNATSLTTIDSFAFFNCENLTCKITIPKNVVSINGSAFKLSNITFLDLSNATSLTSIGINSFAGCSNLSGDIVIPKNVAKIANYAFATNSYFKNICFLSDVPPSLGITWKGGVTGKVYVPSKEAKEAYLAAPNFGFNEDQVEIGLPPEPTPIPYKNNTTLVLSLSLGIALPNTLIILFNLWYLTRNKKIIKK